MATSLVARALGVSMSAALLLAGGGCGRRTEPGQGAAPVEVFGQPVGPVGAQRKPEPGAPTRLRTMSEDFKSFVAERNSCADAAECVLAGAGCPLGCGMGVRKEHAAAVDAKAASIIAEYESRQGPCKYKCAVLHAECSAGRCMAASD